MSRHRSNLLDHTSSLPGDWTGEGSIGADASKSAADVRAADVDTGTFCTSIPSPDAYNTGLNTVKNYQLHRSLCTNFTFNLCTMSSRYIRLQRLSSTSNRSPCGLINCMQTNAGFIWSRCQDSQQTRYFRPAVKLKDIHGPAII